MNKVAAQIMVTFNNISQRLINKKTGVLLVLLFFIFHLFISPIKDFSYDVNYPASPWVFPFLVSQIQFLLLFMSGVVYFYSNVPFMQNTGMYQILRMGRVKWAVMQIVYIILSAYILIILSAVISAVTLFPAVQLENNWGKLFHTISMTDAGDIYQITIDFSQEFMSSYQPIAAMAIAILVGGLVIAFIAMFMFLASLYLSREIAIFGAMVLIVMPFVIENIHVASQLRVAYFSPVSWMRIQNIGTRNMGYQIMPELPYIIVTLIGSILLMSILILRKIKTVDFEWNKED